MDAVRIGVRHFSRPHGPDVTLFCRHCALRNDGLFEERASIQRLASALTKNDPVISRNSILSERFVQRAPTLNVLGCENARLFESILFSGRFRRWLDEPAPTACR